MKEKQWQTTTRPRRLLAHVEDGASERKLRLLAVACCHRIRDRLTEARWQLGVEVAERYADGLCGAEELAAAKAQLYGRFTFGNEGTAVSICCSVGPRFIPGEVLAGAGAAARRPTEKKAQADLVRDIFGNPFRPVSFAPEWRTDTAVTLARTMYESRDFSAMPILADALQDAGCDSDEVLQHCRDPQTKHVRGCWVVDLALGFS